MLETVLSDNVVKETKLPLTGCREARADADFSWSSAPNPAGELTAPPEPVDGFKGASSKCGHHDFVPQ